MPGASVETYAPSSFIVRTDRQFSDHVTIVSGQNLVAGTILGKITSGGKFAKSNVGAGDGSETPVAVLAVDCNASGGDKTNVHVFLCGDFDSGKLTYGTSHTAASLKQPLAKIGIFLHPGQTIDG